MKIFLASPGGTISIKSINDFQKMPDDWLKKHLIKNSALGISESISFMKQNLTVWQVIKEKVSPSLLDWPAA